MAVEKNEQKTFAEKLSVFLTKNRLLLIIAAAVLVVALIVLGITVTTVNSRLEKNTAKVELLQEQFSVWANNSDNLSEEDLEEAADTLVNDLNIFIDKTGKGYPELRAIYTLASLSYQLEDYTGAKDNFIAVLEKYPESHLAAVSAMNAAVCFENLDDMDSAINYYTVVAETYTQRTAEVPHALFSIGRLYEQKGDTDQAIATYRNVSANYSTSEWAKLAVTRIIVLE